MRSIDDVLEGLTKCKMHPSGCDLHCPYARGGCTSELLDDARIWLQQLLWEKRQADKMRKIIRRIIGVMSEKSKTGGTYYASDVKLMLEDILKELRTYDEGESSQTGFEQILTYLSDKYEDTDTIKIKYMKQMLVRALNGEDEVVPDVRI